MDKIVSMNKAVVKNTVTYNIRTEDDLLYQVVQQVGKSTYTECIYFIARGIPHLIRHCELPIQRTPDPDFRAFIEGQGQSH